MGTGKTTIAKKISQISGMQYISTDNLIEKKEGTSIGEIFSKKGEPYFREVEKKTVAEVSDMDEVVIDAGGGIILKSENIENLRRKSALICLWAEPKDILERTKRYTHRPLLNVDDPLKAIKELLDKRRPYYEGADYHVNTSSVGIEEAVNAILKFVRDKK